MKVIRTVSWLAVVLLCAILAVTFVGPSRYEIAGVNTQLGVSPRWGGGTELGVPPFGELTARTHSLPLRLTVEVKGINQDELLKTIDQAKTPKNYLERIKKDGMAAAKSFLLRILIIAALGGLAGAAAFDRRWWLLLLGPIVAAAVIAALAGGVFLQFDPSAFSQPAFSGSLNSIPFVRSIFTEGPNPLDQLMASATSSAQKLGDFTSKLESWQPVQPDKGTVRIIDVSDIHNNPASFPFISRIVKEFDADFIIDTGDITDYGSALEANLITSIVKTNKPYLYVPGNHDTTLSVATMRSIPGVTVLEDTEVVQNGVSVYGRADLRAHSDAIDSVPASELAAESKKVEKRVSSLNPPPLIVAVHNGETAEGIYGKVPIVLEGHSHVQGISRHGATTVINAGTTGASGLRLFQQQKADDPIYTLNVLYVDAKNHTLIGIDKIKVAGLSGEFTLERTLNSTHN